MSDLENISLSDQEAVRALIARALEEDIRTGDVTTNAIVDKQKQAKAIWRSKEDGIIAGLDLAKIVFQRLDAQLEWIPQFEDGDYIESGAEIVAMKGSCRAILSAERIALNIVQRMSGIASMTHRYVAELKGTSTRILDTRKTVPGLRLLDKYAVALGGGDNHRMGLFDLALIKDNHITAAAGIGRAVKQVRAENPDTQIEVETSTLAQVKEALSEGADIIMLDNMSIELMKEAVTLIDGQAVTEASGNITLETIRHVAESGVDSISIGALTHSVKAFDISQELKKIYN